MPFNGSGTYNLPTPEYPAVAGTLIEASDRNTIDSDIATALTNVLTRDGQSPPTANLPMGGFKFTGVGKAAARDQFATYEQVQDGEANFVTAANVTGTANAVLLSVSPAPAGYETAIDLFYVVKIENTSEDVTHNLNSIGNLNTKKFIGGAKVKIAIGDLQVGMMAHLKYDGTDLVLMNPRGYSQSADVASAATIDLDACTGDLVDVTGTTTITAITLRRGQERTIRFTGILTFTHGASLVLPGSTNITTAAGDYAVVRGYAAGVVRCVGYFKATGGPTVLLASMLPRTLTRQLTTSGTSIDFTGISALARRITIMFEGVSTNNTDIPCIQLGDSGGVETSGYTHLITELQPTANANSSTGTNFALAVAATWAASDTITGQLILTLSDESANTWILSGMLLISGLHSIIAGSKATSAVLDRVRLTTNGGTGTFDAGAVSVLVE